MAFCTDTTKLLVAAERILDCLDNGGGFSDDERLWDESCKALRAAVEEAKANA